VFVTLTQGPAPALRLFGPRRTGKTEFLQRDLGYLAAETYGHRVLYASFWQTSAAPLALLLYACDLALRPQSFPERLLTWAQTPPIKIRLGALKALAGVEIDLGQRQSARPADELLLLDQHLDRLADAKRPALLLLDEVQELASHPQGVEIMAGLRTSLDRRREGLRTVFTGSSQIGLNKVFSARNAPLYRFAAPLHLPPMGPEFVEHQLKVFHSVYRRTLDRDTALGFFEQFQGNPMFFQRWLTALGLSPHLSETEAARQTTQDLAADLELDRKWLGLETAHRAMARIIAERLPDPFGAGGAARYAALTGGDAPIPQTRQSYLRTLLRRGIADQWEGEWRISDPVFEVWILDRGPDDF
jgi:hypothetical protein